MRNLLTVSTLMLLIAALLAGPGPVRAQLVPMLFTGTVSVDGAPAPAGTVVQVMTASGSLVGSTTTGSNGQQGHAFSVVVFDAQLEDQQVLFFINTQAGQRLPTPEQPQIAATYDVLGGRGRADVTIAVQTPREPAAVPPTRAFASLIESGRLQVVWTQDIDTGEYRYFSPGFHASTLQSVAPYSSLFINLAVTSTLRIDSRTVVVRAGGRWVPVNDPISIQMVR